MRIAACVASGQRPCGRPWPFLRRFWLFSRPRRRMRASRRCSQPLVLRLPAACGRPAPQASAPLAPPPSAGLRASQTPAPSAWRGPRLRLGRSVHAHGGKYSCRTGGSLARQQHRSLSMSQFYRCGACAAPATGPAEAALGALVAASKRMLSVPDPRPAARPCRMKTPQAREARQSSVSPATPRALDAGHSPPLATSGGLHPRGAHGGARRSTASCSARSCRG